MIWIADALFKKKKCFLNTEEYHRKHSRKLLFLTLIKTGVTWVGGVRGRVKFSAKFSSNFQDLNPWTPYPRSTALNEQYHSKT